LKERFEVLDGWRGISISCVLAGHLLPVGPKAWQLNATVATSGMVLFFILSGFLITTILLQKPEVKSFLIRRFMRIIPLSWLVLTVTLLFTSATPHQIWSNYLFYANWPPMGVMEATGHFWSLCVEVQFYLTISLLVMVLRKRAFFLLPVLALGITLLRVIDGVEIAINTYYRADEILAGSLLALLNVYGKGTTTERIGRIPPLLLLLLLLASAHPEGGMINYLRPYIGMLLVASTLFSERHGWLQNCLRSRGLAYVAGISYALYVFHGVLGHTWLGQGETFEKYAKRPLLFLVTLALAHLSTRYYESYWIGLGKKLTRRKQEIAPGGIIGTGS
jgi:peptidoglycan/LPS O-acetylase OafA/YrhL